MNIEEYKELMKFHILLSEFDLSEYNYAAVDGDGDLYVFCACPVLVNNMGDSDDELVWYNDKNNNNSHYKKIVTLSVSPYWKETLIEI